MADPCAECGSHICGANDCELFRQYQDDNDRLLNCLESILRGKSSLPASIVMIAARELLDELRPPK